MSLCGSLVCVFFVFNKWPLFSFYFIRWLAVPGHRRRCRALVWSTIVLFCLDNCRRFQLSVFIWSSLLLFHSRLGLWNFSSILSSNINWLSPYSKKTWLRYIASYSNWPDNLVVPWLRCYNKWKCLNPKSASLILFCTVVWRRMIEFQSFIQTWPDLNRVFRVVAVSLAFVELLQWFFSRIIFTDSCLAFFKRQSLIPLNKKRCFFQLIMSFPYISKSLSF